MGDVLRHGWFWLSAALFIAAALLLPWLGPGGFGPGQMDVGRVLARAAPDYPIFIELRVSRTLLGLLSGGALALTGALFQAMLRDSLADPYTLGVSSGAALGAVSMIALNQNSVVGAIVGALLVLIIVAGSSWNKGQISAVRLLLSGIALNSICGAFILLVNSVLRDYRSFSILQWLLGSVDAVSYRALLIFALTVASMSAVVIGKARHWNLMAMGEAWAAARGVDTRRMALAGYVCGSVLAASAIALTGPIGFVGLIVPHLVRARISPDNRILMPCSLFLGGVLVASSDAIARTIVAPAELPVGAVMAIIGGPYLVWLVRKRF